METLLGGILSVPESLNEDIIIYDQGRIPILILLLHFTETFSNLRPGINNLNRECIKSDLIL